MAHITPADAQQWAEASKLTINVLDDKLEASASTEVLSRVAAQFDVSGWVDDDSTPALIKQIISMRYTGEYINRVYFESEQQSDGYAAWLLRRADLAIDGIVAGAIVLIDDPNAAEEQVGDPLFYPTDDSSAITPQETGWNNNTNQWADMSVGPPKFSMGQVF